jgi:hypothetical protein
MSVRYEDLPHERPELESVLPDSLGGTPLLKDSFGGDFAVGDEDLYLGVFGALVDQLVPPERQQDGVFFAEQLDRLWAASGYFRSASGDSCCVRVFRLEAAPAGFWDGVLAALGWASHGPGVRGDGLAGNRLRAYAFVREGDLWELSVQGEDEPDERLLAELA